MVMYNWSIMVMYPFTIAMVIMHDINQSVTLANVMTRHAKFQMTQFCETKFVRENATFCMSCYNCYNLVLWVDFWNPFLFTSMSQGHIWLNLGEHKDKEKDTKAKKNMLFIWLHCSDINSNPLIVRVTPSPSACVYLWTCIRPDGWGGLWS